MAPMRVLVTGTSGFVGGAVLRSLAAGSAYQPVGASRTPCLGGAWLLSPDLAADGDWSELVRGCDAVVHCAARVHVMGVEGAAGLEMYRRANVGGTLALARQAAAAGVRRFIFISTVKVLGERSLPGAPLTANAVPAPVDAYAISKLEAEQALTELSGTSGMEVVIIRPPLVYGPGVGANFLRLIQWVERGIPLPLGAIRNKRSFVALDNLVDLVRVCVDHPAAANQTFLVSDGEDLSTTELLRRVAQVLGVAARLLPVPRGVVAAVARCVGQAQLSQRLCESLQVDSSAARDCLGWAPVIGVDEGLAQTAAWYRAHCRGRA